MKENNEIFPVVGFCLYCSASYHL